MTDLTRIEAIAGPLPETNWYDDHAAHGGEVETEPVFEAADAMRDELLAVIERQAKMLRRIDAIVLDVPKTGDPDSAVMDIARVFSDADLARRAEGGESA
jgi:hypothetical protein